MRFRKLITLKVVVALVGTTFFPPARRVAASDLPTTLLTQEAFSARAIAGRGYSIGVPLSALFQRRIPSRRFGRPPLFTRINHSLRRVFLLPAGFLLGTGVGGALPLPDDALPRIKDLSDFSDLLHRTWTNRLKESLFDEAGRTLKSPFNYDPQKTNQRNVGRYSVTLVSGRSAYETLFAGKKRLTQLDFKSLPRPAQLFELERPEGYALVTINQNIALPGNFLIIPQADKNLPQHLTEEAMTLALDILSHAGKTVRLVYNSVGGFASVNHLHFQGFFTEEGAVVSPIEKTGLVLFEVEGDVMMFRSKGYPAEAVVFKGGRHLAQSVSRFTNFLAKNEVPYVIYMAPGTVYVFPRPYQSASEPWGVIAKRLGPMDLAGRVGVFDEDVFTDLTRSAIDRNLEQATFSPENLTDLLERYAQSFPQKQAIEYAARWRDTLEMAAKGQTPAPFVPIDQFDISLVTGARDQTHDTSDFSVELVDQLGELADQAQAIVPAFDPMPRTRLHMTLKEIFGRKSRDFFNQTTSHFRRDVYERVVQRVRQTGPYRIHLRGLNLMPSGTLIVQGYVEDETIAGLRNTLEEALGEKENRGSFTHITLGRIKARPSSEQFRRLVEWVTQHREDDFGWITVEHPVLEAIADFEARKLHPDAMAEVAPYNQHHLKIRRSERGVSRPQILSAA